MDTFYIAWLLFILKNITFKKCHIFLETADALAVTFICTKKALRVSVLCKVTFKVLNLKAKIAVSVTF